LRYLCEHEWARDADDALWRRSKLGLHYNASERAAVARWFEKNARATNATVRFGAN
jgi:glycerol-3-phosphate dehydrogenase